MFFGNIAGKGGNAGDQHFLLFPQHFLKGCSKGSLKVAIVWKSIKYLLNGKTQSLCREQVKICLQELNFFSNLYQRGNSFTKWQNSKPRQQTNENRLTGMEFVLNPLPKV